MKLTDSQKILVEDNHNLIYHVCKKLHLNLDEYYDVLALSLCKAAVKFKPDKGVTFSTFAIKVMTMDAFSQMRKDKVRAKHTQTDFGGNGDYNDEYIDLSELDSLEKRVVDLKVAGYTQKEIADIIGITKSKVVRILGDIKYKLRKCNYD